MTFEDLVMIQESTSPVVATWPTVACESSDHGSRISVAAGVISFFRALHPDYASGSIQMELPTLCADPPKKDYQSLLQGAELATRMTCAYVGLPATVVACIGGAANLPAARYSCFSLAIFSNCALRSLCCPMVLDFCGFRRLYSCSRRIELTTFLPAGVSVFSSSREIALRERLVQRTPSFIGSPAVWFCKIASRLSFNVGYTAVSFRLPPPTFECNA